MTRRGDATRARLMAATRSVVREVGYAHASTRAIAQAAGVAEGTIYRHFPDKTHLFFATVLDANAPVVALVASLPARAGENTVEDNLAEAAVQLASLRDEIMPLEFAIATDPQLAAERQRAMTVDGGPLPGPPEAVAAYLAAEQALGRVRIDLDPREVAAIILGTLFALVSMPSPGGESLSSARVASAMKILVRGILPDPNG